MAHFSNFIQKCQFEGCRYHDFLPHKCEYCELMFCELHKKAQDHVCSKLKHSDLKKVILCEYCNAVIPDEEEEIKWHLIHKCTYIKKATKPKICDKEKCKTVLNDINSYFCKQCKKTFCLPHRYDFAHKCISDNKYKKGFFEKYFYFF